METETDVSVLQW